MTDRTRIRPVVAPGTRIAPALAEGAMPTWRLSRRGGGASTLPAPLVAVVMLFDGERSFAEIDATIRDWGMRPPREDFVEFLAHQLSRASLVRLRSRQGVSLEPQRFECTMCGESCRGAEIGPLTPQRVETLEAQRRELVEAGLLPETPHPLRVDDAGHTWLARHGGQCTFLLEDHRCLLHARFGFDAKPLACQLFPVVAVEVEGEVRLGISGACVQQHRSFESGELLDLEGLFARMEREGVRALPRRYAAPHGEAADATATQESELLAWLLVNQVDLAGLLGLWLHGPPPPPPLAAMPPALAAELRAIARAWASSLLERSADGALPLAIPRDSSRGEQASALAHALRGAADAAVSLDALPARWLRYLNHRLRTHVWLRVGYRHGTLDDALLIAAIGAAVAVLYARHDCADDDSDEAYDHFARAVTLWFLAVGRGREAEAVLGPSARRRLREAWPRD